MYEPSFHFYKRFKQYYEKAHPTYTLFYSPKKTKKNNFVTKIYIKCGFKFDHNMIIELLKVYLLY